MLQGAPCQAALRAERPASTWFHAWSLSRLSSSFQLERVLSKQLEEVEGNRLILLRRRVGSFQEWISCRLCF